MSSSENMRRHDGFAGKADDFYEALLAAHDGLTDKESAALNARLVLLLANHIGSLAALCEALALARAGVRPGEQNRDAASDKNQHRRK